jgi:HSP20 family protein
LYVDRNLWNTHSTEERKAMLIRFDPFRELDRIADEAWGAARQPAVPMDAVRRGDAVHVSFDLPGVDPSTIDVEVERNVLTVSAERRPVRQEGDEVIAAERRYGTFTRQLMLGDSLDAANVEASYDAGVLSLTIPVAEVAKPRKVAVSGGAANGSHVIEANASDS